VIASRANLTNATPPGPKVGSVDLRAREERAKSSQKAPPAPFAPPVSSLMPADEPFALSRVIGAQPCFGLNVAVVGAASQL
jgi:hypothetical protein